MIRSLHVKNHT